MAEHTYKPKLDDAEMHIILLALTAEFNALMEAGDREGWLEVGVLQSRLLKMLRVDEDDMARITAKAEQSISEWKARNAEERARIYGDAAAPVLVGGE